MRRTLAMLLSFVVLAAGIVYGGSVPTTFTDLSVTGDLKVGNGTPSVTQNGEDAYIEGTFEVDGAARFDGQVTFTTYPIIPTVDIAVTSPTIAGQLARSTAGVLYISSGPGTLESWVAQK